MELTDDIIQNTITNFRCELEKLLKLHPKISPEEAKHEADEAAKLAFKHIRVFIMEVEE